MARSGTSARSGASSPAVKLLPADTSALLRRRAIELGGLAVAGLALLLLLALFSWHGGDPSWNKATAGAARNLLGRPGASVADTLLQMVGLGAVVPVLALLAWAWRIASHRGLTFWWANLGLLPVAIGLVGALLAYLPTPAGWPFDVAGQSLGGSIGFSIASGAQKGFVTLGAGSGAGLVAGLVIGLGALASLVLCLGLSVGEWRTMGRGLALVGAALGRGLNRATGAARSRRQSAWDDDPAEDITPVPRRHRGLRTLEPSLGGSPEYSDDADFDAADDLELAEHPRAFEQPAAVPGQAPARSALEKRVEIAPSQTKRSKRAEQENQTSLALGPVDEYSLPPLGLLKAPPPGRRVEAVNEEALEQNARLLEGVLDDFGVRGQIVKVRPGPVVTLYELEPAPGTKSARVIGLADDIARSMSAVSARVSVIPGRNVIGIELPNQVRETVYLSELLASPAYESNASQLPLALGKDIGGGGVIADLTRMPHLLVAGTTGSGKSVAINTMIMSLLYRLPPDQCKFIMIDPKMLELSVYDGIPHLLAPVVTEPGKAVVALKWTVREMEDRYRKMSKLGVRNIAGFNQRLAEARANGEVLKRTVQTGFDPETGKPVMEEQPIDLTHLPFIVVIVDEMADLMMVAGKDIEGAIQRLAQMARAAGIHIVMATQRPSVDVITGTIKANFPTRISFQVTSRIDSRTILGEQGAEQLLGQGDMLYMAGGGRVTRVHGPFVSDHEVEQVVAFLKDQGEPSYLDAVTEEVDGPVGGGEAGAASTGDDLYDRAVALVAREGKASTSFIQRHLQIGYNRAARIIEEMETQGVVGKPNHVGKREVLVGDHSADAY